MDITLLALEISCLVTQSNNLTRQPTSIVETQQYAR